MVFEVGVPHWSGSVQPLVASNAAKAWFLKATGLDESTSKKETIPHQMVFRIQGLIQEITASVLLRPCNMDPLQPNRKKGLRTLLAARAPALEPWCAHIPGHSSRCPGMLFALDVDHGHKGSGPRQRPAWAPSIYNLLKTKKR